MYVCIYIYRLVPSPGTTYDWVGGWGGMLTFMWTCRSSWCYANAGWGGGEMGWDVNVHVKLQKQLMLRTRGVGWGVGGVGCQRSCEVAEAVDADDEYVHPDDDDDDDPNETCQFRDENSSRNWQVLPTYNSVCAVPGPRTRLHIHTPQFDGDLSWLH